jgi:hypothetical protein
MKKISFLENNKKFPPGKSDMARLGAWGVLWGYFRNIQKALLYPGISRGFLRGNSGM